MKRQSQSPPPAITPVTELIKEIQTLRDAQNKLQKDFASMDIASLQSENKDLRDKFQIRDAELLETINKFVQNTAQDMEKLHKDTLQHTTDKVADYVAAYIGKHSVSKEDFETLKNAIKEMSRQTRPA